MTQLKFGTYSEINGAAGKTHEDILGEVILLARHADTAGYDVFTALEHPFFERFSINPAPLSLFCTLAPQTKRIRFRTLCHTMILHNPMVLAGEIAEADVLTYGRLECGLGRGHPWLCEPVNVPYEEANERFREAVEIIRLGLTQEKFSFKGKHYACDGLSIVPRPYQRPHPPFFIVGTSGRQFAMAAERGCGIVVGAPAPTELFIEPVKTYIEACRKHGTTPHTGYMKVVYVAETDEIAHREARPHLLNYMQYVFSPFDSLPKDPAGKKRLVDAGYGFYASDELPKMRELPYEKLVEMGVAVVGSPATVTEEIRKIRAKLPFDELLIVVYFGDIPYEKALKSQEMFARHVMPALKKDARAKAAA